MFKKFLSGLLAVGIAGGYIVLSENRPKAIQEVTNIFTEHIQEVNSQAPIVYVEDGKNILDIIPEYSGSPYVVINNNEPNFSQDYLVYTSYTYFTPLDSLGRCGVTEGVLSLDTFPVGKERESIGMVKPTGWQTIRDDTIDGSYLYNRCHLIGWQLSGENANEKNLITGTRYMNVEGMLPFENMVADYVYKTNNHVAYRVTPVFEGGEKVARGVLMEAYSVEDNGEGVKFNVFCYNVQPGYTIDYATGKATKN